MPCYFFVCKEKMATFILLPQRMTFLIGLIESGDNVLGDYPGNLIIVVYDTIARSSVILPIVYDGDLCYGCRFGSAPK